MSVEFEALWYLHQLKKSQWFRFNRLRELQEKKLRAIVRHAYNNVAFYHRRFDALGIKPEDIKTINDLVKIPLTTRINIQENFPEKMVARGTDLNQCIKRKTSGSTGTPINVVFNKRDQAFRIAVFYRALMECGLKVTDKLSTMARSYDGGKRKWFQVLGLLRQQSIHPTTSLENAIQMLRGYRPDVLYAYASYLTALARVTEKRNIKEIRPRLVFSHAELLDDEARAFINRVFDTEMFDTYGSIEFIRLAWECPEHTGYHIDSDGFIVEFLRNGENVSSGERGEMVVTSLHGYAMPFLRYTIGDYGVAIDDECSCGRGLPLMKHIEGRAEDFIILPDGLMISPRMLTAFLGGILKLSQYRVIQEKKDVVRVELSKEENVSEEKITRVIAEIKNFLTPDVNVYVKTLDQIPVEKSGKVRKVMSEVSSA